MSRINIFTLPKIGSAFESGPSLREEIEAGLLGQKEATVPGERREDEAWAFRRSVPTVVLYDEQGLRLYDKITAQAPEYYLFNDELNLLKEHGDEIARSMGFPGAISARSDAQGHNEQREEQEDRYQRQLETDHDYAPAKPWKPARWGDADVGKWNNGVNGEAGMGGGFERGYDVVELGAGALRKTGHLLAALAAATAPSTSSTGTAPIMYHPLDLSHPELHRVLGEMDEAFGERLGGKVECIGLHGDYSAGLQYIREGKLASLRELYGPEQSVGYDESLKRAGEMRDLRIGRADSASASPSPDLEAEAGVGRLSLSEGSDGSRGADSPPLLDDETSNPSPPFSPAMTSLATPQFRGTAIPPLVAGDSDVESLAGSVGSYTQRGLHFRLNADKDIPSSIAESSEDDLAMDTTASAHLSSEAEGRESAADNKTGRPLHMVFLGSSLGNFARASAAPFLASLPLKQGDTLLLGLDGRPHPGPEGNEKVRVAYNDPAGHTKAFEEHGWEIVRRELGLEGDKGVEFVGRYNEVLGRHESYYKSLDRQTLHLPDSGEEVTLEKDELLNIEWSYKYSTGEALDLFKSANLRVVNSWKAPTSEYRLWLLERPSVYFGATRTADTCSDAEMAIDPIKDEMNGEADSRVAKVPKSMDEPVTGELQGVPSWAAWQEMWALWDHITLSMIPPSMLHSKPIDLRHICLFYLGHIPTFLDIHLTRLTEGKHTEPEQFKEIFERGIDPDVDDPTQIHDHSEVPVEEADWPTLDAILGFRNRVRERLHELYVSLNDGSFACKRKAGRVLFMTYEHEAMHAETLLYMLIQSPSTRAPSACAAPRWDVFARQWQQAEANKVLDIPAGTIAIGHDDLEAQDDTYPTQHGWSDHQFGWDNEHPTLQIPVQAFKVDALPVSNADYLAYAQKQGLDFVNQPKTDMAPASWIWNSLDQEWNVRTLYGPVGFDVAGKWPLQASKVELDAYAKSKGGRLPKEHELRWFWEQNEGPRPAGEMANVGFKNWHPVPPTLTKTDHAGKILHGHNGGVWEWTDTEFEAREGYVPSKIYPGYSADFYDGKHFVAIGGSYATVPAIAGRKSFRNWYQANYRFSFVGARVAYDA